MAKGTGRPGTRVIVGVAALLASVIGISWMLEVWELGAGTRLALALVPVAAYVYTLVGFLRLLRETDEMQQRIHLEALAIAFPSSAVAIFACEYLRKAGFITALKPDWALMIMLLLWGLGLFIAWRRYQ